MNKFLKKLAKNMMASKDRPNLQTLFFTNNKVSCSDCYRGIVVEYKNRIFQTKNIDSNDINENTDIDLLPNKNVIAPDIESFFLKNPTFEIWVNPDFLIKVLQIYKEQKIDKVKLSFKWSLDPIQIDMIWVDAEIKTLTSIIMPIKL